ncbi:helix-turn-helix domain-containing protein [Treponema peruense]|uniref:Helix-turn-helix domain-containing protein n=1 Tax=Treponema peruense TaxID=2787628 RepID=A0A7T3V615_9SPIR|nr:helix-turn-helix transcriptional regulator [Treponema peruense]QQA01689.1 helix-turn-helix domain-containing protein [Treponema peruense]
MSKRVTVIMPQVQKILSQMGDQIKLARLRRKLSAEVVSERAGISRATLWQIENGSSSVSIGSYASVLTALALQNDLLLIAKDDVLGRTYQDLNLKVRKRTSKTFVKKTSEENKSFNIMEYLQEYKNDEE